MAMECAGCSSIANDMANYGDFDVHLDEISRKILRAYNEYDQYEEFESICEKQKIEQKSESWKFSKHGRPLEITNPFGHSFYEYRQMRANMVLLLRKNSKNNFEQQQNSESISNIFIGGSLSSSESIVNDADDQPCCSSKSYQKQNESWREQFMKEIQEELSTVKVDGKPIIPPETKTQQSSGLTQETLYDLKLKRTLVESPNTAQNVIEREEKVVQIKTKKIRSIFSANAGEPINGIDESCSSYTSFEDTTLTKQETKFNLKKVESPLSNLSQKERVARIKEKIKHEIERADASKELEEIRAGVKAQIELRKKLNSEKAKTLNSDQGSNYNGSEENVSRFVEVEDKENGRETPTIIKKNNSPLRKLFRLFVSCASVDSMKNLESS